MNLERIMLILAGLMGLGAFFLPFLHFEQQFLGVKLIETTFTGYNFVLGWLDYLDFYQSEMGAKVVEVLVRLWENATELKAKLQIAGLLFVLAAPVIYALYCLGYLFRGLMGWSFKRGIWFNLLFMPAAWGIFYWISQDYSTQILGRDVGLQLNFFSMAGVGYWLAFAAVFIAGFSLIFEQNKAKG